MIKIKKQNFMKACIIPFALKKESTNFYHPNPTCTAPSHDIKRNQGACEWLP